MHNPTTFYPIEEVSNNESIESYQNEIWRNIPDYGGIYQASDLGRIRKMLVYDMPTGDVFLPGHVLHQSNHRGYRVVSIDGSSVRVHRLVLMAFRGIDEHRPFGHHINHTRYDNRLVNLEWVTHVENMAYSTIQHQKEAWQSHNGAWPNHYQKISEGKV